MRKLIFFTSIALLVVLQVQAQAPAPAAAPVDTRKLAEEWMKRLNALSDWYISFDGKEEGVEQRVDSMMELYAPDVVAEVPHHGADLLRIVRRYLRKWVDKIARTQ